MKVAHILRKYDPAAWGGTETAVLRLTEGLRAENIDSVVYCPRSAAAAQDPFQAAGCPVKRYRSFLPVAGLSQASREQLIAWGGNLMSLDLPVRLLAEPGLEVIHTHALNRLAGAARLAARLRRIPLAITIHGGALDLPATVKERLTAPLEGGFEWGKMFGFLLRSRQVLAEADAVFTCNPREADLLREKYPRQRVEVVPHAVPAATYERDHRAAARQAFPQLAGREPLLVMGRLEAVKNQVWLVDQLPEILRRHPRALAVLAGSTTDPAYEQELRRRIGATVPADSVLLTGGLAPQSPEVIGLFQLARALALPSLAETFGLVIIEAWAAGTPVISTRTSGALSLVRDGENGWLFDLDQPAGFHQAVAAALAGGAACERITASARKLVRERYDVPALGRRLRSLYGELIAARKQGGRP